MTAEHTVLIDPLDHPELLSMVLAELLQNAVQEILLRSASHSLVMLQSARDVRSDGRYYTHLELQVRRERAGVKNVSKTFGLMLAVKEEPTLEL